MDLKNELPQLTTPKDLLQFHILSFEGPDLYARAGGIASRIGGLVEALARFGYETHLWFIGDPHLPGHETSPEYPHLHLHRWCQWISAYHPAGVYENEEGKIRDYAHSLPLFLCSGILKEHLERGGQAVIMAEEWHTVDAVLHLDYLLKNLGLRQRVQILWNANNSFGFHTIDFGRLKEAAVITTVSKYMKFSMHALGVDPLVLPNGLAESSYTKPSSNDTLHLKELLRGRLSLAKVARWDPDKRWLLSIDTLSELKQRGLKPLLIARGGFEAHAEEVFEKARHQGLTVTHRQFNDPGSRGLLEVLKDIEHTDILNLHSNLDITSKRLLFHGVDAVLANSGREPFGLVGLETMAVEGVAVTGCSGEDYAVSGCNALVLQTNNPTEFFGLFKMLKAEPGAESALRKAARLTAKKYAWPRIIEKQILPRISLLTAP